MHQTTIENHLRGNKYREKTRSATLAETVRVQNECGFVSLPFHKPHCQPGSWYFQIMQQALNKSHHHPEEDHTEWEEIQKTKAFSPTHWVTRNRLCRLEKTVKLCIINYPTWRTVFNLVVIHKSVLGSFTERTEIKVLVVSNDSPKPVPRLVPRNTPRGVLFVCLRTMKSGRIWGWIRIER